MKVFSSLNDPTIVRILMTGGIGVLRTDTLYGLVASAHDQTAVDRIYRLKHRDEAKSPIVLIASLDDLFDDVPVEATALLSEVWPGKTSIILPSTAAPEWIRRDNGSVAYRLPDDEGLRALLARTGPLVAPSANPENEPPAMNIGEAEAYFGDSVDVYVDGGVVTDGTPSRLIRVNGDGSTERLR